MSDVNPCFSEDIWFEILKNLPVKTLGKCRCVCKSWHSLIVSPSFMSAHFKHYTQNIANSVIFYKKSSGSRYCKPFVQFCDSALLGENCSLHTSNYPVLVCDYMRRCFQLIGSVYGLLCLFDDIYIRPYIFILIWNPVLQQCIKLPITTFMDRTSTLGFGYDCRKNDHRVVRICFSANEAPVVEVFSVQEQTRRIISADYLVNNSITNISSTNCFVNGVIHWFIWDSKNWPFRAKTLLMFDVSDEKFEMMELPGNITNMGETRNCKNFGIFEYQGMLSLSLYDPDISSRCQIWVQREYNDASSWYKILDVTSLHNFSLTVPVQYLGKNGELLGSTIRYRDDELMYYDTRTADIKDLGFHTNYWTSFSAYSESLVFLDQN
ncbi:F-box/kelch-repeat protein At3g23880-like [Silene latifolia]|uniref:F-box/kelch-repeat protein At3g23880-like n=1 Tax=Silene latifolia TaxID=37657 RepID=UPI003D76AB8E